ncbi:hypothetical protein U3516DRAFT_810361 [Neocallimastix sp. 'constans']
MEYNIKTEFNNNGDLINTDHEVISKHHSFENLLTIPYKSILEINGEKEEKLLLLEIGNVGYKISKLHEFMINIYKKFNLIKNKMQQISLFLSSVPIDQENPSMEIVQLSSTLPILSASLNKFKTQILYLQHQIELCIHELYLYSVHLQNYIKKHTKYLSELEDDYDAQNAELILIELEKRLAKRIEFILNDEEETDSIEYSKHNIIYENVRNEVMSNIIDYEKEVLTKTISKGKQSYMNLINKRFKKYYLNH